MERVSKISKKDIEQLSGLAHIGIDKKQSEELKKDLEQILKYIEVLEGVDTKGHAPSSHTAGLIMQARPDSALATLASAEQTRQALPKEKKGFARVPTIIKQEA